MPVIETKGALSSQAYGQFARQVAANYIEDVFSTWLYTGNGSTQTITNGIDLAGKGGLVWIKRRDGAFNSHRLFDTNRGSTDELKTDSTTFQTSAGGEFSSFGSNGFSLGPPYNGGINTTNAKIASWTFRKQAKFFDVVTYTGNGSVPRSISHSLESVPGFIVIKCTSTVDNWICRHRSAGDTPNDMTNYTTNDRLFLNTTGAAGSSSNIKADASTFTVNHAGDLNASGQTYVAYLFAHNAGGFGAAGTDNVISCGSFTTDGSGNATVNLGWEPQWFLTKSTGEGSWLVADNMRGLPADGSWQLLFPNSSSAEGSSGNVTLTSTGINLGKSGDFSGLSPNVAYIYIAIRRGPMRTPTSGTSVFGANLRSAVTLNGTDVTAPSPLPTAGDWFWLYNRGTLNDTTSYPATWARLIGGNALSPQNTNAQTGSVLNYGFGQNTIRFTSTWDGDTKNYVQYFMCRAPGFFDVVCWTGNGVSNQTLNHNLAVVPELIIQKRRSSADSWYVLVKISASQYGLLYLNSTLSLQGQADTWVYGVTSTTFRPGTFGSNTSGQTFVSYLFASCPGVSKVGSYTGTGTTQQINCGFTGGARFVMIKRTDSTGDWYVWDTARGIVAGNDPYLRINSTAAEVTSTDYIDTLSTGFEISSTAPAAINANGGSFIFLAIS